MKQVQNYIYDGLYAKQIDSAFVERADMALIGVQINGYDQGIVKDFINYKDTKTAETINEDYELLDLALGQEVTKKLGEINAR